MNKICKVSDLIHQVLPRCFRFYGLWLTSQIIKSASQSIISYWYQSIGFIQSKRWSFIRGICCFHIIHHNSMFSTHVRRLCYSNKWKAWHLCCCILKLFKVQTFACSKSPIWTKTNNKDTEATSLTLFYCLRSESKTAFTPYSCASVANFEQVILCWDRSYHRYSLSK